MFAKVCRDFDDVDKRVKEIINPLESLVLISSEQWKKIVLKWKKSEKYKEIKSLKVSGAALPLVDTEGAG